MNLIEFLKRNKDARKIFGKRELKIIEKQLLGVNLTQSEKNRLSRDTRKKLNFIKEVNKFSEKFGLKKGLIINEIVNETKEVLLESKYFSKIKKIIMFGSAVENKLSMFSDIDIAVEFDDIDKKESTRFRIDISGKVNKRVDIQVYNILPDKIKKQISENRRILYERKN